MNSNSIGYLAERVLNGIGTVRFRKLDCCSELYTLLVDCTPRMTELPAGRFFTATLCTCLFTTLSPSRSRFAQLVCSYAMGTTLTQRHQSHILSPAYHIRIPKMEFVWANNCRSVFASSMPTSKGTFNRCPDPLRVGIRFITMKIEALRSYLEDTKIPRIG